MKTYRKPKAKIVNIKGQVVLAGSDPIKEGDNKVGSGEITTPGGFASKSIFDYESE